MSRALPLQPQTEPVGTMVGTVAVFDPAMCCPTGLCGPGVDPALLTMARDLRWLEKEGVVVKRYGLSQQPEAFVANTRVAGLMQAFGDSGLPAVLVDDVILCHGRYPTREEMVQALAPRAEAPVERADGCCTPGSGCC